MKSQDENNFRSFFNEVDDFLFILDLDGRIIEINRSVTSILGYTNEELIGQSVLIVHPPELREKAREIVGKMIEGERISCPLPLLSKSNAHIPAETRVFHGIWNSKKALIGVSRNLSEIALSEDRFFKIFNDSQILMVISEIETGLLVNVNKMFLQTLGFTSNEIVGKYTYNLDLFTDHDQRDEFLRRIVNGGIVKNEYLIAKTKTGELVHTLFSAEPIQLKAHNYLLTSAIDITQLKATENKLKHNLKHQTLLAEISQNLNSIHDISRTLNEALWLIGNHTDVSRVYIFEDSPDGTRTSNTYEWCNQGIQPQKESLQQVLYESIPSWKKIFETEGKIYSTKISELPEDISRILIPQGIRSILVFPLYVQEMFFGFIGFDDCLLNREWNSEEIALLSTIANFFSNTFERKKYHNLLRESEAQLKMAIESTETGLWDWDIPTGKVYFNDIWCNMLGYDKSEIKPHVDSWDMFLHPEDKPLVEKTLEKHLSGETESYCSNHRLKTKTGEWKWIMDKGKVIEWDEMGKPVRAIGTHIDIDSQKKIEKELQVANATKDKFFSIISHDLRGPVGSLMQISELLSDQSNLDEKTLNQLLEIQKEMSFSTFQLLENLLNWARINSKKVKCNPKPVILNHIIEECIGSFRFQSNKKNIILTPHYSRIFEAFADEEMVKFIIRNLLSNAIKFTPKNGLIKVEVLEDGSFVVINIYDTGVGISKENILRILSDVDYYSSHGIEKEKGTGLGLKLCKEFIALNGGSFKVESELNKGSLFSFTLPVLKQPEVAG